MLRRTPNTTSPITASITTPRIPSVRATPVQLIWLMVGGTERNPSPELLR
ncbi:MAG TPA: hypothetical protein QGI07_02285 [Dehalococcoidia bacterium]|nr:hypothetical protein [Dehalococcoidia bacterium]MDP7161190.1 hypothetical protein [Dehalococcoidia bacterium]MDP7213547.1 hypothetical protein [Dehalococcoidia bacterium]MDP7515181.1 hypothetical protein [Dehalococcoidia bacterium]HJM52839.1 hypothetical protein [Dehalococcoidia bacterium]